MKVLRKAELIIIVVCVVATILKLFKLHLSGIALVISMSGLAIIYWIYAFSSFKSWKASKSLALLKFAFNFFLSFLIYAMLFLIMFWPGGSVLVYQSLQLYFFASLTGIIYSFFKSKEYKINLWSNLKPVFFKFSLALVLGLILWFLPDETRIKLFAINPDTTREHLREFRERGM